MAVSVSQSPDGGPHCHLLLAIELLVSASDPVFRLCSACICNKRIQTVCVHRRLIQAPSRLYLTDAIAIAKQPTHGRLTYESPQSTGGIIRLVSMTRLLLL